MMTWIKTCNGMFVNTNHIRNIYIEASQREGCYKYYIQADDATDPDGRRRYCLGAYDNEDQAKKQMNYIVDQIAFAFDPEEDV